MDIKQTHSLCEHCYKHVEAQTFERDGAIWMSKDCPEHGVSEYMIESNAEFYHSLDYDVHAYDIPNSIMIEVTDRCNLNCPHCYHEPENKTTDVPISFLMNKLKSWPQSAGGVILAGAEPTIRKDLPELITTITDWQATTERTHQDVTILTNGVKLSDKAWTQKIKDAGCSAVMIGLNHPSYQGEVVHRKQLQGIANCVEVGLPIYYIGYTIEDYDQLPFVLNEIQEFGDSAMQYRIRAGSDIGRNPDEPKVFLSENVKEVKALVDANGWEWEKIPGDDNLYHYMVKINGITHRIIQWSDPKTIDLQELKCGPWCDFVPGKPVTNLLHQVMLRDHAINEKMFLLDTVPEEYTFKSRLEIRSDH